MSRRTFGRTAISARVWSSVSSTTMFGRATAPAAACALPLSPVPTTMPAATARSAATASPSLPFMIPLSSDLVRWLLPPPVARRFRWSKDSVSVPKRLRGDPLLGTTVFAERNSARAEPDDERRRDADDAGDREGEARAADRREPARDDSAGCSCPGKREEVETDQPAAEVIRRRELDQRV